MSDDFNPGGMRKLKSASGQTQLDFGAFNGKGTITIFSGQGIRPKNLTIPPEGRLMLVDMFTAAQKGAPGARSSLTLSEWDRNMQPRPGYKRVANIVVGLDDTGIGYIEVTFEGSAPETYPIKGTRAVESSLHENTPVELSKRALRELTKWLSLSWETIIIKTNKKNVRPGGTRPQAAAPQAAPAQPSMPSPANIDEEIY